MHIKALVPYRDSISMAMPMGDVEMRLQRAMIAVGIMAQMVAGCSGDFDVPPQRGIQADIDASRTQRGDALYPDSTIQQRRLGVDRY